MSLQVKSTPIRCGPDVGETLAAPSMSIKVETGIEEIPCKWLKIYEFIVLIFLYPHCLLCIILATTDTRGGGDLAPLGCLKKHSIQINLNKFSSQLNNN